MDEVSYGLFVHNDGTIHIVWTVNEGQYDEELWPDATDVPEAIAIIRKIIWGV